MHDTSRAVGFGAHLAAVAWPLLVYLYVTADAGTVRDGNGTVVECASPVADLVVALLAAPGVILLVAAASAAGTRRRRLLAAAVTLAALSITIAALATWAFPTTSCQLF